jgi:hypothetical protein
MNGNRIQSRMSAQLLPCCRCKYVLQRPHIQKRMSSDRKVSDGKNTAGARNSLRLKLWM